MYVLFGTGTSKALDPTLLTNVRGKMSSGLEQGCDKARGRDMLGRGWEAESQLPHLALYPRDT